MRTRHLIRIAAAIATFALFSAPSAGAEALNQAVMPCTGGASGNGVNAVKNVDPLVDPGVNPTAHSHTQEGANVFTAGETIAQMMGASGTTCALSSDRSMAWTPTVFKPDGTPATVTGTQIWVSNAVGLNLPTTSAGVASFDPGLRWVKGDHNCTQSSCGTAVVRCTPNVQGSLTFRSLPTPEQCSAGTGGGVDGLLIVIYATNGPHCWDGVSQGEGFGTSGSANVFDQNIVDTTGSPGAATCPASNPHPIPGVAVVESVGRDAEGGCTSSDIVAHGGIAWPAAGYMTCAQAGIAPGDGGFSEHADFVFGFTKADMATIDDGCLNGQYGASALLLTTCIMRPAGSYGPAGLYNTVTKQLVTSQ